MATELVFETHSLSEDNEAGRATGWLPGRLSERGRQLAEELGERRRDDGMAVVFTSDLHRAVETADIAFGRTGLPILHDWRLRECNYGQCNGMPSAVLHKDRRKHLDQPYPGGESWRGAIARVGGFLNDLLSYWPDRRVLVIGHVATRWAFDALINGVALDDQIGMPFDWREGWEYRFSGLA
jgi:broad specificity phosphatase PhoE